MKLSSAKRVVLSRVSNEHDIDPGDLLAYIWESNPIDLIDLIDENIGMTEFLKAVEEWYAEAE